MLQPPRFTIFTPTFNRAHTLTRTFNSLLAQTYPDFEWLIIDDGSSDNTKDLISTFRRKAPFAVRYVYQTNGGKHRAHNTAMPLLMGKYTVILDSDDELTPPALEILYHHWQLVETERENQIIGILGRSIQCYGQDQKFSPSTHASGPDGFIDGHHLPLMLKGHMVGDLLPCYRTDILRLYKFPTRLGDTSCIPEGVLWLRIGQDYRIRCIEKNVRIYHRDPADTKSLMHQASNIRSRSWSLLQYSFVFTSLIDRYFKYFPFAFFRSAADVSRFSLHCGDTKLPADVQLGVRAIILICLTSPIGCALWFRDLIRSRLKAMRLCLRRKH
jgi:glycosyltransferase involved in cell wall biosynthesis